MALIGIRAAIEDEVSTILATDFAINVTQTSGVPHSDDPAITFPNLDDKSQNVKLLESCVLYVDMRRSTALSLKHRPVTVAKLYSSFVRAMTRCADEYGGEVRGIIGDRVMMIFEADNCFANAVNTAILVNSVCQNIINKHFKNSDLSFGIGIDHGQMLATKTGVRRHGSAQQSYRNLVWLGRPANIASKLTDQANKPADITTLNPLSVAYGGVLSGGDWSWQKEYSTHFVTQLECDAFGRITHKSPYFKYFVRSEETYFNRVATPAILMTQSVYNGYRASNPNPDTLRLFSKIAYKLDEYNGDIYGGDVTFTIFST